MKRTHQEVFRERQVPAALWVYSQGNRPRIDRILSKQTPDDMMTLRVVPECYERMAREQFVTRWSLMACLASAIFFAGLVLVTLWLIHTDPLATKVTP